MAEQHYRVVADASMKDLRTGDLAVVRVAEGFEDGAWSAEPGGVRIERPVPTTDMTAMSHETTGFCFCGQMHGRIDSWNEHDWAALREYMPAVHPAPNPHPPTREQIAEAIEQDERVQTWHTIWAYVCKHYPQPIDDERTAEQYVLALIQHGADRG